MIHCQVDRGSWSQMQKKYFVAPLSASFSLTSQVLPTVAVENRLCL